MPHVTCDRSDLVKVSAIDDDDGGGGGVAWRRGVLPRLSLSLSEREEKLVFVYSLST